MKSEARISNRKWKKVAIAELVDPAKTWNPGRSPSNSVFHYIDLSAIDQDAKLIAGAREVSCGEAPSRARQLVARGDVLVSTVRPNLNGVAPVPDHLDGATASTGFCVLRARAVKLDSNYLFQWVKSPSFVADMVNKATGASYPAVSDRIIFDSRIPLPPLAEQRRIAEVLDRAEALRTKRRAALAYLDSLVQAAFVELFGSLPDQDTVELDEIAELKRGPFGGSLKKEIFVESGYKVYEQRNAIQGDFAIGRYFITERKYREMEDFAISSADLIVSCSGTLGKVAIVPDWVDPGIINQALLRVRPDTSRITPLYLKHALETVEVQTKLSGLSHGTGLQNFPPMTDVRALRIRLPSLRLQREFTRRVRAVEKLKTMQRASLTELDALFATLQHRAFRGGL